MSAVDDAITTLFSYTGLGFTDFILIIIVLSSIIFSGQDYKIGLIACLLLSLIAFVFFVLIGADGTRALILFFVTLILMAFSIYTSRQKEGLF
jgi:hypothetical protein